MTSKRRIQASRANGARSRGPKTPESKARSAANSQRHGLLSRTVVLQDESRESFAALLDSFERELAPRTEIERILVENLAAGRWRTLRLWAIERNNLTTEMENHRTKFPDPGACAAQAFRTLSDTSHSLDLLNRYEARFDRQFSRALNLLLKLRATENAFCQTNLVPKSDTPEPAPEPAPKPAPKPAVAAEKPAEKPAEPVENPAAKPAETRKTARTTNADPQNPTQSPHSPKPITQTPPTHPPTHQFPPIPEAPTK